MRHTTTGFVDSERTENGTNTPGESVTLKNGPSKDCKVVEPHVSEHIEHVEEEELSDKTITGCHKSRTHTVKSASTGAGSPAPPTGEVPITPSTSGHSRASQQNNDMTTHKGSKRNMKHN